MNTPQTSLMHRRHLVRRGFTLVETVLALAIVAGAVLSIVAMLPIGLEDLRKSYSKQAEARIIQTFIADYEMKSWGKSGAEMTLADKTLYFDSRGTVLPKAGVFDHAFTAKAVMQKDWPKLPGDPTPSRHVRRLDVKITDRVNDSKAFNDPKLYIQRTAWVANFDQTKL
ncbi:Verru_Chthon cassette protein B [Roseimicrobium sp. ORNL1]|uniref:Verru_Chthon cassette protein B n=1 Tax=Roseimicrobium sp. ORNL1 TaxID=2711231 RepID=UPI0013E2081F|nr:Verru_Chthon cassette protein B [Roseimicrobium sp. ORNL1]QIF01869.1 Verru_Chthon cassette protein B [Roseimicrobium sp. ORNL1]